MTEERVRRELLKWHKARDVFLGRNWKKQDMIEGLRLATHCEHEDAQWLIGLFPTGPPATCEDARKVFLAQGEDARALCFAGLLPCGDKTLILRAAEKGDAFIAQGEMASLTFGRTSFAWAEKAAAQKDSYGLAWLAWHFSTNMLSKSSVPQLYKEAAELDNAQAQYFYGEGFKKSHPERYFWWGKAAANGYDWAKSTLLEAAVVQLRSSSNSRALFEIGNALREHVDRVSQSAFGDHIGQEKFDAVLRVVAVYDCCCGRAKESIYCWTRVGRRKNVAKDIRLIVAKMLWSRRVAWIKERFKVEE